MFVVLRWWVRMGRIPVAVSTDAARVVFVASVNTIETSRGGGTADAADSKSAVPQGAWGFKSPPRHHFVSSRIPEYPGHISESNHHKSEISKDLSRVEPMPNGHISENSGKMSEPSGTHFLDTKWTESGHENLDSVAVSTLPACCEQNQTLADSLPGLTAGRSAFLVWLTDTIKNCPALSEDARQLIAGIIRMDQNR